MFTVTVAILLGVLVGPLLRGEIFSHSVPAGEAWRHACPHCSRAVTMPGRILSGPLPPTGRCPHCRQRVGPSVGVVEAMAGVSAGLAAAAVMFGPHPSRIAATALVIAALFGLILSAVDLAVHRLPDRLTGTGFAATAGLLVVAAGAGDDWRRIGVALVGAALLGAGYVLMAVLPRAGMGLGDVKLAPLVGLVTGWFGLTTTIFAALVGLTLAGLVALGLLLAQRAEWHSRLAHGPYMLAGALIAVSLSVAPA